MINTSAYSEAVIACHRFGFGGRNTELKAAQGSPKQYLLQQLTPVQFNSELAHSSQIQRKLQQIREEKKMGNTQNKGYSKLTYLALSHDNITRAITSDNALSWRLLAFFSNHFSVSAKGQVMTALAPTLEREAIADNFLGEFEHMLLAVIKHPAMLIYLNNEKSFGPNSRLGKRGKGMNENLAREIMELHTLGVDGGYQQQDVQALAKAITGWSVANPKKDQHTGFKFRGAGHEPGPKTLLGNTYSQQNIQQGEAMLRDLARHASTARHICFKLARHFVQDDPPQVLLDKMFDTWQSSNGHIKQVMETMINHDLSWRPLKSKYKTPREHLISAYRCTGIMPLSPRKLVADLQKLGQKPFNAGSPAGYDDISAAWDGASALDARIEWSASLAAMSRRRSQDIIQASFADTLSETTNKMLSRAESQHSALTMLLLSPEFLLR